MSEQQTIEQLTKERDDALAKLRESEAKVAALHDAIDSLHDFVEGKRTDTQNIVEMINACQSPDFGYELLNEIRRLRSKYAEMRPLLEEVVREHADPTFCDYNGCDKEPCLWCSNAKRALSPDYTQGWKSPSAE